MARTIGELNSNDRRAANKIQDWHGFEKAIQGFTGGNSDPIKAKVRCCGELHEVWLSPNGQIQLRNHRGRKAKEAMLATDSLGYEVRCLEVLRQWRLAIEWPGSARKGLPKILASASRHAEFLKIRRAERENREWRPEPLGFGSPSQERLKQWAHHKWEEEWARIGMQYWMVSRMDGVVHNPEDWFRGIRKLGLHGLNWKTSSDEFDRRVPVVIMQTGSTWMRCDGGDDAKHEMYEIPWLPVLAFFSGEKRGSFNTRILYATRGKFSMGNWRLSECPTSETAPQHGEEDEHEKT